jgi:N-methylhydantoinase A
VVGHLPPRLIGGEMALDVEKARAAVQTIADATGLSLDAAAEGILAITNETMAGALRLVSVQRGHDPREFALVAFGGAGPLHANAVAALMGSFPVIVPPSPGLLCALGDLVADFRGEFARTLIRLVSDATPEEVLAVLDELEGRARQWMADEDIASERQGVTFVADMRYHGQGYEIPVPLDPAEVRGGDLATLDERFNGLHDQLYGFRMPNTASEIVNLRAVATGDLPKPELPESDLEGDDASGAIVEQGEILFEGERRATPIYDRAALRPGNRLEGPAIVTEFDSTTVVLPGYVAEVDRYSNILITEGAR